MLANLGPSVQNDASFPGTEKGSPVRSFDICIPRMYGVFATRGWTITTKVWDIPSAISINSILDSPTWTIGTKQVDLLWFLNRLQFHLIACPWSIWATRTSISQKFLTKIDVLDPLSFWLMFGLDCWRGVNKNSSPLHIPANSCVGYGGVNKGLNCLRRWFTNTQQTRLQFCHAWWSQTILPTQENRAAARCILK